VRAACGIAVGVATILGAGAAGAAIAGGQGTAPPGGTLSFRVVLSAAPNRSGINPAVPRDKKRPKISDVFAGNGDLVLGGKKVGKSHFIETVTDQGPKGKKYKGGAIFNLHLLHDFGGGDLLFMDCKSVDADRPNVCAITGGTGRYAGARGSAVDRTLKATRRQQIERIDVTFVP
jgi:hypothetical protein